MYIIIVYMQLYHVKRPAQSYQSLIVVHTLRHERNHSHMQYARLRQACHVQGQTVPPNPEVVAPTRSSTRAVQGEWLLYLFLAQVSTLEKYALPCPC
jgi:hypothetical protein